jgi:hypothetical protein
VKKRRNQSVAVIHITEVIDVATPPPNPSGDANDGGVDGMTAIITADFQYLRVIEGETPNINQYMIVICVYMETTVST